MKQSKGKNIENSGGGDREYNVNLDLIRVIAILMVLCLHMSKPNRLLDDLRISSISHAMIYFFRCINNIAVNLFGLLSGYLLVDKRMRHSKLVTLYIQVLFYSLSIFAIFGLVFSEDITFKNFIRSIFIVQSGTWWYFSSYFCLFFFIPILNKIAEDKRLSRYIIGIGFVFFQPCY